MTLEEYNACRLPQRLSFREREAARLVLVHGMSFADAASCCGMNEKGDIDKVKMAVEMFQKAHENRP